LERGGKGVIYLLAGNQEKVSTIGGLLFGVRLGGGGGEVNLEVLKGGEKGALGFALWRENT